MRDKFNSPRFSDNGSFVFDPVTDEHWLDEMPLFNMDECLDHGFMNYGLNDDVLPSASTIGTSLTLNSMNLSRSPTSLFESCFELDICNQPTPFVLKNETITLPTASPQPFFDFLAEDITSPRYDAKVRDKFSALNVQMEKEKEKEKRVKERQEELEASKILSETLYFKRRRSCISKIIPPKGQSKAFGSLDKFASHLHKKQQFALNAKSSCASPSLKYVPMEELVLSSENGMVKQRNLDLMSPYELVPDKKELAKWKLNPVSTKKSRKRKRSIKPPKKTRNAYAFFAVRSIFKYIILDNLLLFS